MLRRTGVLARANATSSGASALTGPGLAGISDYNDASLPVDSFQVSSP